MSSLNVKIEGDKELIFYLNNMSSNLKRKALFGLDEAGDYLEEKIKAQFGKYHPTWPKLKIATVIAKYRRRTLNGMSAKGRKISFGIGTDDPLLLFGNLRNSIQKELNQSEMEVVIFSDNEYAAVHEYGYKSIPARSYMRTTLDDETEQIVKIVSNEIGRII